MHDHSDSAPGEKFESGQSADTALERLRSRVMALASSPSFRHHPWYTRHHLLIVEQIATELTEHYPAADHRLVLALVWLHDLGKIVDPIRSSEATTEESRGLLAELGFSAEFTNRAISAVQAMDRSTDLDLSKESIEVQIASSADGCSHLAGPFMQIWWWENADKPYQELMADNLRKLEKDWNRKVVLPLARALFEPRYKVLLEQNGMLPRVFIPPPS